MGHAIERIALGRGHEIVARIDSVDDPAWTSPALREADVAIEFTMPKVAESNVERLLDAGIPVVSGTTAWQQGVERMRQRAGGAHMLWSSNFSVGVNVFRQVNSMLARIMGKLPQYTPSMTEVHHIHKLDHPSGTAVTIAEDIMAADPNITAWTEEQSCTPNELYIAHRREGEVPGIHSVKWDSAIDTITLTHEAKSRDGFALGAVLAAEWLPSHPGFHTIDDLMADLTGIK